MSELEPTTKVEIVATALRSIWEERGGLVPEEVVEVAAEPDHPLHPFFEWDDTEAARRFRVMQAGALIRSVKITVTGMVDGAEEEYKIREWVAARYVGAGHGYRPEPEVRENPEQKARLLRQMQRDLQALRRRYQHLAEFWRAIEELGGEGQKAS